PLRFGHGAERPYPSDRAEGGRQHPVPYGALHRLSATSGRHGAGTGAADGAARGAARHARRHHGQKAHLAGRGRRHPGLREDAMKVLIATVILLLGTRATWAEDMTITIKNFDFMPMDVTVAPGTTVVWKNLDGEPHTVASADGLFRSQALDQNDSFRFTFQK